MTHINVVPQDLAGVTEKNHKKLLG